MPLALLNLWIGVAFMYCHDDGTVIRWCARWRWLMLLVAVIAAFLWPISLCAIYRKQ